MVLRGPARVSLVAGAVLLAAGVAAGAGVTSATAATTAANTACPWVGSSAPVATKVSELLSHMTLTDKISMVHGVSGPYVGNVAAIPALCVPTLTMEDGPAGVGDGLTGVTQLPAPVAAAATWDSSATHAYGAVIGSEDAGKGIDVDLGPTINIVRDPRWGRAFESMGEDPYLTGQLGASEIQGIQGQGVMAQVKHLAVYNQETNRNTAADDAIVSNRTMQEIYLPAFQAAIQQGHASSAMCSYSSINGTYACQDPYLETSVLRNEFGFTGFVTSDWGATHSTVPSANAGLSMEMPGDTDFGSALQTAVTNGQVSQATLNSMVSDILTEMFQFGLFDRAQTGSINATVTSAAHQQTAQGIAEQGTVLLKNNGNVLPLGSSVKSVAVIGADASASPQTDGGGSAGVTSSGTITPLQGITARAGSGVQVNYAEGPSASGALPAVPASAFTGPLAANWYNNMTMSGTPVATTTVPNVNYNWGSGSPLAGVNADQWSATFTGTIDPTVTGTYTFSLSSDDGSRLLVNGATVIDNWRDQATNTETGTVSLTAGTPATVEVEYYQDGGSDNVSLGWQLPSADPIAQAVAAAQKSDVAVVFASDFETEGADLTSIDLPGQENQLISAVAAANPNTVVVLNTGSAVTMPWLSQVKSVLEAWYPGQEDGAAIAAVLFGDVDPSGHLPVTFPTSLSQVPASTTAEWPGVNGQVQYSEGIDVGYRWYQAKGITPLFPFGYGLSYTQFKFSNLTVSAPSVDSRQTVTVTADVTNTGNVEGADVAQLYVGDPASTGEPPEQLKGFQKVDEKPGQTKTVVFHLPVAQAFSYWDSAANGWTVANGTYRLGVGDSSASLPLTGSTQVTASYGPQGVTLAAPSVATPGTAQTVTATVSNADSDVAISNAVVTPSVPVGWTVTPANATIASIAAHRSAAVKFQVTAPASAAAGSDTLSATAAYSEAGIGQASVNGSTTTTVPYSSLSAAFNDIGITDNSNTSVGDWGAAGYSFSAEALAAVGVNPGQPVTSGGFTFTWPSAAAGTDDMVTASGETIEASGSGSELGFLGAANNGSASGTVTIGYTDGTTSTGTLSFDDWYNNAASVGDSLVATTSSWNEPGGSVHQVSFYLDSVPLTPGKTIAWVQLPNSASMHIFAMAAGN